MASNDKLWFELGVRDRVSKVLTDIMGKTKELQRAMVLSDKDLGFGTAIRNASKLEEAIMKVSRSLKDVERQKQSMVASKNGGMGLITDEDERNLAKVERRLKKMLTDLNKIRREFNAKLKSGGAQAVADMNIEGLIQGVLDEKGFALAQTQVNTLLSDGKSKMNAAAQAAEGLASAYDKVTTSGKNTNSMLNQIAVQIMSVFSIRGIEKFAKNLIEIGGEFEIQRIALENILGDAQKANELYGQLKTLAVESPFSFRQQVTFSKQLSAFNIPYNELYDTTKRLSDMSAGLGVDMSRLILAYGQVRSAAVLRGQELRQFTEAGIPMVQALADEFTKLNGRVTTTGDVFKLIQQRAVPFEMVKKVLWDMTSEGGRFYNMQYELADTLAGKWSNLRDAWEIMLSDFAKGESLGGSAMKGLVTLTTKLIQGMHTLSPLIYGVLGSSMLTKGASFARSLLTGNFSNVQKNLAAAQKLNAIEINRRMTLGQIDKETRDILLANNANMQTAMGQLAITGRMSTLQMYQAYNTKNRATGERLITKEYIEQAAALGIINAKEAEAIINGKRRSIIMQNITKRLNIGVQVWASVAMAVGLGVWQAYSSWIDNIEQRVNNAVDSAKSMSKEFGKNIDVYKETGTPTDDSELRARVKHMKELLESNELYTEAIKSQVEGTRELNKQYEILLKALTAAKEQADWLVNNRQNIEAGIRASSSNFDFSFGNLAKLGTFGLWDIATGENTLGNFLNFFFDDDIDKNLGQYSDALTHYENQKNALLSYKEDYVKTIDFMKEYYSQFSDEVKGMSEEEALAHIGQNERWMTVFKNNIGEGSDTLIKMVERFGDSSSEVNSHMKEIIENDAPKMFKVYADELGMNFVEYAKYCNKHESYTRNMITSIVASLEKGSNAAKTNLAKALLEFFGLAASKADEIVKDSTGIQYKQQTDVGKTVLGRLIRGAAEKGWGNNGQGIWDVKWINKYFKEDTGFVSGISAMRNRWSELKEEREAAERSGGKLSSLEEAEWQKLEKVAQIYDFKNKKSKLFGNSSSNKKDQDLEEAKTQLEEIKKFYAEYKKYRDVYGAEKGQSMVEELFGIDHQRGNEIVNDYKGTIRAILNSIDSSTEQRKKFKLGGNQLLGEIDLDKAKRDLDYALKDLQEYISKQTASWNLYKQLLEKTGNKDFAMNAFRENHIFDDAARDLERQLMELTGETVIDYDATQAAAEKHYENNKQAFELWKKIVDIVSHNYTNALTKGADAIASQLTITEKIRKNEEEIARLRKEGAGVPGNEARIRGIQKENDKLSYEAFQQSVEYLQFFGSVLAMTNDEMERVGQTIKNRLITELANGNITAHQYIKSLKDVNQQLEKGRGVFKGNFMTFLTGGGQKGMVNLREEETANAAIAYEAAKKHREELEKQLELDDGLDMATSSRIMTDIAAANKEEEEAKQRLENTAKALGISVKQYNMLAKMSTVLGIVNGVFSGLQNATKGLADMFDALGKEDAANFWSDLSDTIGGISSVLNPVNNIVQNAMNGNVSGIVSSAISAPVDLFTGPITAFAKLHDKQIQREIEASKQRMKEMQSMSKNLETALDRALGGIYNVSRTEQGQKAMDDFNKNIDRYRQEITAREDYQAKKAQAESELEKAQKSGDIFAIQRAKAMLADAEWYEHMRDFTNQGVSYLQETTIDAIKKADETGKYYDLQRASLAIQRDELQHQIDSERDKKKSDSGAISDMEQQLKELEDQMYNFAKDMAKTLYDIDVQNWASQLGDALYEAWQKGEDGIDAYKKKLSELIGTVTKNILVKRVIETALEPVEKQIVKMMDDTSGELNEEDFANAIGGAINEAIGKVVPAVNAFLDAVDAALKSNGLPSSKESGDSSMSGSIKSITENTADLLASYLNAVRADVSVNRYTLQQILSAVQGQSNMPVIAQAQLQELQTLVSLARERTIYVSEIRDILHRVTPNGDKVNVN